MTNLLPSKYSKLNEVFYSTFSESAPFIFLHEDDGRDYNNEEFEHLHERGFETKLLLCRLTVAGKSVCLRTHFSDNHKYDSHLNYVRDFYKAAYVTRNLTAAKTTASELLYMFFNFDPSQYYSMAVTIASGLSNFGENIDFEKSDMFLKDGWDTDLERRKLCLLMDVLFSRIASYRFLLQDGGCNTYRVVHCGTKTSVNKRPLFYAVFSFLIQLCLTIYVVMENLNHRNEFQLRNLPLAILTFIYSSMIAYPQMTDASSAFKVYGRVGPLQMMDCFVNEILTFILLFSGFAVILIQDSFIEAVLNTAALLFIPEIDDQLPSLLGLEESTIIENYLTYQMMKQFESISKLKDEEITRSYLRSVNTSIGIRFNDHFLCNIPEEGSRFSEGINFTPYQIRSRKEGLGHQIDPVSFVTENCLIKKLVWSYTSSKRYEKSSHPRIGYLKIEKFNDQGEVEIIGKGVNEEIHVCDNKYVLEGVFIITSFQMSDFIFRLRVCGAPNAKDFLNALEYYSLWGLSANAARTLERESYLEKKHHVKNDDDKTEDATTYVRLGERSNSSYGMSGFL